MNQSLTDARFWDAYWSDGNPPSMFQETGWTAHWQAVMQVLESVLPRTPGLTVLELGAAPGGNLAYFARRFRWRAQAIDCSPVGCQEVRRNFARWKLPVTVWQGDLLSDSFPEVRPADVVYSLGLVEHFRDPLPVLEAHCRFTKPGGTVLFGFPNALGLNRWFIRLVRPDFLAWHNLDAMQLAQWDRYEHKLGLRRLIRGYYGGWEPRLYHGAGRTPFSAAANKAVRALAAGVDRWHWLRRHNSRWWSGYCLAVYEKK